MQIIDPMAIATAGYLDSEGNCTPLTIATDGYIVTIEKDDEGGYIIRPKRRKPVPGPMGIGGDEEYDERIVRISIEEEDEEILMIIRIFLQYESSGLLT